MKQQLEQRLQELKAEFDSGQKVLTELEAQQANTRSTLLRISGAIQVLEEMLNGSWEDTRGRREFEDLKELRAASG